jgi:hypothetical protein
MQLKTIFSIIVLATSAVARPEICTSSTFKETALNGNGGPHQNFVFKQVSGVIDCTNNPLGTVTIDKGQSVAYTESINLAIGWITGGFSVEETTSTGYSQGFGCKTDSGTHKGSLCAFQRIQVTAYTVHARQCTQSSCAGQECGSYDKDVIFFSPNTDQGDCFYDNFQLNLPCTTLGAEHHYNSGPAGSPHFVSCQPARP